MLDWLLALTATIGAAAFAVGAFAANEVERDEQ